MENKINANAIISISKTVDSELQDLAKDRGSSKEKMLEEIIIRIRDETAGDGPGTAEVFLSDENASYLGGKLEDGDISDVMNGMIRKYVHRDDDLIDGYPIEGMAEQARELAKIFPDGCLPMDEENDEFVDYMEKPERKEGYVAVDISHELKEYLEAKAEELHLTAGKAAGRIIREAMENYFDFEGPSTGLSGRKVSINLNADCMGYLRKMAGELREYSTTIDEVVAWAKRMDVM